jgi:hypothetical protein
MRYNIILVFLIFGLSTITFSQDICGICMNHKLRTIISFNEPARNISYDKNGCSYTFDGKKSHMMHRKC